jgi:hypothetical protein
MWSKKFISFKVPYCAIAPVCLSTMIHKLFIVDILKKAYSMEFLKKEYQTLIFIPDIRITVHLSFLNSTQRF